MLTTVEATNFKCFGKPGFKLDLAPLTFLVGPNGSGKSSVLDAILLLAQTAEMSRQGQGFEWKGPLADLGDGGEFALHKLETRVPFTLGIGVAAGDLFARWSRNQGLTNQVSAQVEQATYAVTNRPSTGEWAHELYFGSEAAASFTTEVTDLGLNTRRTQTSLVYPPLRLGGALQFNPSGQAASVLTPNLFLGNPAEGVDNATSARIAKHQQDLNLYMTYLGDFLRKNVFVVGADRSVKESEMKAEGGPLRVGRRGERTFAVLSIVFAKPEYASEAEGIRHWAEVFGLSKLSGGWSGGTTLGAGYVDSQFGTPLPTGLAGYGSQQMLPVIVQLFSSPTGSSILIEEPEISLHPAAQVDAVRMLAAVVGQGKQVIVTTHSQTLLLALSEIGNSGTLRQEDVAVYHFSRQNGLPAAAKLAIDETWYIRGWIPSFSEVESKLLKRWITNVGDRIKKET